MLFKVDTKRDRKVFITSPRLGSKVLPTFEKCDGLPSSSAEVDPLPQVDGAEHEDIGMFCLN